jgi:two-component system, OmpR family, heavy metal sensor histidine kinase CusS
MRLRNSLTLRLSLLFAVASTVVLLTLGQFIARSVETHFVELDQETAAGKLLLARTLLAGVRERQDVDTLAQKLAPMLIGHDDLALRIETLDGQVWFANDAARALSLPSGALAAGHDTRRHSTAGPPAPVPAHAGHAPVDTLAAFAADDPLPLVWRDGERSFRGLTQVIGNAVPGASALRVSVGVDTTHHDHYLRSLRHAVWSFVALAVVAMGILGWMAARSGLAPRRAVGLSAARVTAARLDHRLPADDLPAEVADLAQHLNAMLARLEVSFERLSALSSDLAHELRTPVAGLITQTQVALARERDAADYRETLVANAEGLDRLSRMVSDMLLLARSEHGLIEPARRPLSLAEVAHSVLSFHEALAADHRLTLGVDGDATVQADRGLLTRAMSNLVSNAIRHAEPGTPIVVAISTYGDHARVSVRNEGEPVTADVLARMFDRFFRADAARARDPDGSGLGLGLAITRSIARAHGGEACARSAGRTTEVWIDLPISGQISAAPPPI